MMRRKQVFVVCLAISISIISTTPLHANFGRGNLLADLNLTDEQVSALAEIASEFSPKQMDILAGIELSMARLQNELMREGRLETETAARKSSKKFNSLFKEISNQTGELLKIRVAYLLKAKNILTQEQRLKLLANLEFDIDIPQDTGYFFELNILDAELDLTPDQEKKILKYRADMAIKEIKISLDIDYKVIDLEEELSKEDPNSKKVDQLIVDLTLLGIKLLDSYVDAILKTKDVFTIDQKKELIQMIMLAQ